MIQLMVLAQSHKGQGALPDNRSEPQGVCRRLIEQLYLSGRRGCPFLTAFAERVGDFDQLSGDGGEVTSVKLV